MVILMPVLFSVMFLGLQAALFYHARTVAIAAAQEGAQVYGNLRARSAGMRSAMLNAELAKANEIGERMSIPMSILGVIFLALLICPALLRILGGT